MIIWDHLFSTLVLTVFITWILGVHSLRHTALKALRPEWEATMIERKIKFLPKVMDKDTEGKSEPLSGYKNAVHSVVVQTK